jgi:hypothetical protein
VASRREERAVALVIALLFLVIRAAIAYARDPFFDELFTVWMARRPFSAILPTLLTDSGPPLYYFLARIPSVMGERILSIAFASVPLFLLLRQKRWIAAMLLTVHPAAAILGATGRQYALCGALIAIGVLLMERDRVGGAAVAFVAAAYTHFAAAFFLPTLLLAWLPSGPTGSQPVAVSGESDGLRARRLRVLVISALAATAFLPGLWLSLQQPRDATAWMEFPDLGGVLNALAFIGDDPGLPSWVMIAAFVLTVIAGTRSRRLAPFVLIPLLLCLGVSLYRPVYFPIRFASLLAFPLVLWIADPLEQWGRRTRIALLSALITVGFGSILAGVITHLQRPLSDYRLAAIALRHAVSPNDVVVATGYLYLESVHQLGDARVRPFPPEQGVHPGWRVPARLEVSTASLPAGPFVWIGERSSPELVAIRRARKGRVLYENGRALIMAFHP